jgi:hypothetical protein
VLASVVGLVTDAGSLPPVDRLNAPNVLPPRLGGSYITLPLPFARLVGMIM